MPTQTETGQFPSTLAVDERGAVMMEFVIAFPVVLILCLGAIQFAHIWMAKQVVHYAAYCAARAELVDGNPQAAARTVCAWISFSKASGDVDVELPGWGAIKGSGGIDRKLAVEVEHLLPPLDVPVPAALALTPHDIRATVSFDLPLMTPIVGPMIGWGVNTRGSVAWEEQRLDTTGNIHRDVDLTEYPHLRLSETTTLHKPAVAAPF
jgi:hypothetical protein